MESDLALAAPRLLASLRLPAGKVLSDIGLHIHVESHPGHSPGGDALVRCAYESALRWGELHVRCGSVANTRAGLGPARICSGIVNAGFIGDLHELNTIAIMFN